MPLTYAMGPMLSVLEITIRCWFLARRTAAVPCVTRRSQRGSIGYTGALRQPTVALVVHRYPPQSTEVFSVFGYMIGYMTTKSGDHTIAAPHQEGLKPGGPGGDRTHDHRFKRPLWAPFSDGGAKMILHSKAKNELSTFYIVRTLCIVDDPFGCQLAVKLRGGG